MKKIRRMWEKHWNCLPWFICGIVVLVRGEIGRFTYGAAWLCVLILIWRFLPTENISKLEEKENE